MNVAITIGGNSRNVRKKGFRVDLKKNNTPATATFQMIAHLSEDIEPEIDDEVSITLEKEDTTTEKVFGGRVLKVQPEEESKGFRVYTVTCIDYTRDANKGEPIAEIFRDQTGNEILTYLLANYPQLSGFTMTNANATETIDNLFCDHLKFTDVLAEIAQRTGLDYYIDPNKDIHIFTPGEEASSIGIDEVEGAFQKGTMKIKKEGDKIVNWVLVEGGEYDANETESENFTADGSQTEFNLDGRYSGVTVTVAGTPKDVGVFGIDDQKLEDGDVDCLYDFSGRRIVFRDDNKPTSGQAVVATGYPKLPVLVQADDSVSIEKYGLMPKKIKNERLKTVDSAKQVAFAELQKYSNAVNSGGFTTRRTFIKAGESITVSLPALGISEAFYVQGAQIEWVADGVFETKITIASAETIDAVGVLQKILNRQTQSTSAEQILNQYKKFAEIIKIADEWEIDGQKISVDDTVEVSETTETATNKTLEWVHGEYIPTGFSDSKRPLLHDVTPCHA